MFFFKKIKFTIDLIKAFDYYALKRYKDALNILKKYELQALGKEYLLPEYYILYAVLLVESGNIDEAEEKFKTALKGLDNTTIFNEDEINYLKTYIYDWLIYLHKEYHLKNKKSFYYNFKYDNIRKSLKINFDHHFIWDE